MKCDWREVEFQALGWIIRALLVVAIAQIPAYLIWGVRW